MPDPQEVARQLMQSWGIAHIGRAFEAEAGALSWVAPVTLKSGAGAVLKIAVPHMEAQHEVAGLRFWAGDPTVFLLQADESRNALLLERCSPGTALRSAPAPLQDEIVAALLRRLWRSAPAAPFRPLSAMLEHWSAETRAAVRHWPDHELVRAGLELFRELGVPAPSDVLLATDLHAGNVLRAEREPWLVIDPKPFVGDPCYDATQHLLNSRDRLTTRPRDTVARFADRLGVAADRVRHWLFARLAAEPRERWDDGSLELARRFAI